MYIYPDNMKGRANMFLWRLYDVVIIVIGAVISITAIAALNFVFPAALVATYALMSIRFEDMSIFDYLVNAFKFCVSTQQLFIWRCGE